MSERLVNVDRETPMLLPVDLRDWVPEDDMVHFVLEAIEAMPSTGNAGTISAPLGRSRRRRSRTSDYW